MKLPSSMPLPDTNDYSLVTYRAKTHVTLEGKDISILGGSLHPDCRDLVKQTTLPKEILGGPIQVNKYTVGNVVGVTIEDLSQIEELPLYIITFPYSTKANEDWRSKLIPLDTDQASYSVYSSPDSRTVTVSDPHNTENPEATLYPVPDSILSDVCGHSELSVAHNI